MTTVLSRRCWMAAYPRRSSLRRSLSTSNDSSNEAPPTVLVMGVANHRSIAWACVESFRRRNFNVIVTYQNAKMKASIDKLIGSNNRHIQALPCNVESETPQLFQEQIPDLLRDNNKLDAIVHSIAYAPFHSNKSNLLSETSLKDYQMAQQISAFSLLETAQQAQSLMNPERSSITALTYLGAARALPQYSLMGPCKAALEACVRGLAVELGPSAIRVNAVSAGPLRTLSSRGIPQFIDLWQHAQEKAPLQRNVTAQEVADTISFLATEGTGITGQVVYVDAGYSSVVPV